MSNTTKNVAMSLKFIKTKKGNVCALAEVDLGYRKVAVTFDELLVAELFGLSVAELYSLKEKALVEFNEVENA